MGLPVRAATFTVTNTNDSGAGSLRQAVTDANTAGGANTVTLQTGLGTITLLSDLPLTATLLTVIGNGNTVSSSGFLYGLTGSGNLATAGPSTLTLAGSNTYSGATFVNAGVLQAGSFLAFSSSSDVTIANGAAVDLNGTFEAIGSLAGGGTITNSAASPATLATNNTNLSSTFSGTIEDGSGGGQTQVFVGAVGPAFTLTLTGTNTYTGGTAICTCATLQLGNGGATGSILGDVLDGGTLAFNRSDTYTFTGTIADDVTDAGKLVQMGPGTTILTGTNTYTGGTTISGGTLQLGNGGTTGSILGDVIDNGTLAFNRFDTVTFSGQISGSGGVNQIGPGTTILTAANTYTGATTITGGTLQGGVAGAFSAGSATSVGAGGTLDLGGFVQTINALALNGGTVQNGALTGAVTSKGGTISALAGGATVTTTGGTTILTGVNAYTGATTIMGGALKGGSANTFSAGSPTRVGAGGILDLGGFAQTISAVALNGGTLQNGALAGAVTSNGGTISALAGGATVTTIGGTTIANGANTYTGPTHVNGGTFQVDGSVTASNITVANGGTLSGIGKIGDPTIAAGGTLAPGNAANAYGTLTIVGPLGFAPGSFYNVNINANGQNSRTNVVGTATIGGGTVNAMAGRGTYTLSTRYTILNATGGITGTFAGASTNLAFLTPSLTYDATHVYLSVTTLNPVVTPAGNTVPNYQMVALTGNQSTVAAGLTNAAIATGGTGRIFDGINQLTAPQARGVFEALSGEGISGAEQLAFRSAELFTATIFDQTTFYGEGAATNSITLTAPIPGSFTPLHELADLPSRATAPAMPTIEPSRTWRAWATGFGGIETVHGSESVGSATQNDTLYGGSLGVDYQLLPQLLVGVALGGSDGSFAVPNRATSGSVTGGHVAAYDLVTYGSFYGASSVAFSAYTNKTDRSVFAFGGLPGETERGTFGSREIRTRVEFGRHFEGLTGLGTITPFVAIEAAALRSDGFGETAQSGPGLFALNVAGQTIASVPAFIGARLQHIVPLGSGMALVPSLELAYVHEFAPDRGQLGSFASLPSSAFVVEGARPDRNAAQVKAGGELRLSGSSFLFANFNGEFGGVSQFYAGKGGFRYVW